MANRDRHLIDHRFPLDDELGEAIHENRPVAELVGTGRGRRGRLRARRARLPSSCFEVYAPIENSGTDAPIGAYEIYANPQALSRLIGSRRTMLWLAVGGVFLALWAALALLVRGASRTLSRQNAKLRARTLRLAESNRLLEESALEAVESLNATVDAKDPYTAGHSQRVQRIAVALGEELGLDRQRLESLRFAGPLPRHRQDRRPRRDPHEAGSLTELEFEIVKRHPEDGARIVGRLHRLHAAVPAILHHHERWDGHGYPHGAARRRDPARGRDRRSCRRVRRDDDGSPVQRRSIARRRRPTRSSATAARSSRRRSSTRSSRSSERMPELFGDRSAGRRARSRLSA